MLFALLTLACHAPGTVDPLPTSGEGLFLGGCPKSGRSNARTLTDVAEAPWGPDALAAPGDVLLMNSKAAFVIQSPDAPRTYYHYGGTPIDAVAVDGCAQAGPEVLGEMGFVVGQLDLLDFGASQLHMIRGESAEIVSDGSDGGPAIVDIPATDDRFWLVELTLIRGLYMDGSPTPLGPLFGLDITLRYALAPDDATLQIDVLLDGSPATDGFLVGSVVFPSDYTPTHAYSTGDLSLGGFGLDIGVPWEGSGAATGATAIAMPGASLSRTSISGVTALIDANQAVAPLFVRDGDAETRFLLAVGPTDPASAAASLEAHHDDPVPGHDTEWKNVAGTVLDPDGAPVAGLVVEVSAADDAGSWPVLTELVTDATGAYAGRVLVIDGQWRLQATGEGRDDGAPVEGGITDESSGIFLSIGAVGALEVHATDEAGAALPVRIELERADGTVRAGYPTPQDPTIAVPPGRWSVWVSRGYEHAIVATEVDVSANATTVLNVELPRVVDTDGWVSFDSHVHAGPSADSDTLPVARMRSAAGSGLDAMISTDHEAIIDLSAAVTEAGLGDHLLYVLGSEVTASLPEHTNAWPFPVTDDERGDPVRWYELGFPGIYAAERARGAGVIQLNHARVNGENGILAVLDWDRLSDAPRTDTPEALGLPPGAEIWSWDFDSFEVINGLRSPYFTSDTRRSGALYDWLAFHNLGHRVTGVAVTDTHGDETPGTPRTWVPVADDRNGGFAKEDLVAAVTGGSAQFSAGAFARVEVNGAGPGETVAAGAESDLWLHVEALPEVDVTRIDVLVDCDLALSVAATDPTGTVKLDVMEQLVFSADAYVVVIVVGEDPMPRGLEAYDAASVPRVVTNPIFVDADGDGVWTAPGAKTCDWAP